MKDGLMGVKSSTTNRGNEKSALKGGFWMGKSTTGIFDCHV